LIFFPKLDFAFRLTVACIHQGGTSRESGQSEAADNRLFQVRGTSDMNTKAFEVKVT